jgi:hypothetical protein
MDSVITAAMDDSDSTARHVPVHVMSRGVLGNTRLVRTLFGIVSSIADTFSFSSALIHRSRPDIGAIRPKAMGH